VSGCTTAKAARQSNQRASQTKIKQAAAVVRRSLTWRSWYSANYLHYATKKERYARHTQGTLLKQGNYAELLSLLGALLSSDALPSTPCRRSVKPSAGGAAIRLLGTAGAIRLSIVMVHDRILRLQVCKLVSLQT